MSLPPSSRVMLLHVEERADETIARFVAKGRADLQQALKEAIRERKRRATRMLELVGQRLARRGLAVDPVIADGHPAEEIIRAAERQRTDLVVLGSRGLTGFTRILLGSVSRTVARHAPCSVLVVRR